MVNRKNSISVILPNFNGKHLMEMYIPVTIEALNFSSIDYEIIVVDDCSTDGSSQFIEQYYPQLILIKNAVNSGFSYTCNQGIAIASKELVFLLNSDVKLTKTYFEEQFKYFDCDNTFGVMGRIMNFDGKKIEDAARFPSYKGSKFKANTFYYLENENERALTCYLSGANALINREKLQLLKGFDEIYTPFYFEDFDLGLRAWKMGWSLYYEHQSICYHHVSSSTNMVNASNFVQITYNRNSFILQSIHLNGFIRKMWYLQLFTIILIGHLIKGDFWILKSIGTFLHKKCEITQSRDNIHSLQQKLQVKHGLHHILSAITLSIKDKKVKWL